MAVARPSVCVLSKIPGMAQAVSMRLPDVDVMGLSTSGVSQSFNGDGTGSPKDRPDSANIEQNELALIKTAEILLADPDIFPKLKLTNNVPKLKWVQSTWAGVDSIIKSADSSKPFPDFKITRFSGYFGPVIGEFVLGHIIAHERHFFEMKEDQKNKSWNTAKRGKYRLLSDLSIGIIGLGDIGKEIARLCKAFGMTVWGLARSLRPEGERCPHVDMHRKTNDLPELLSACDYVCNVLPNTEATAGFFDGNVLSHCKSKNAVFINVGRGNVISEDTLFTAFSEQWLSHAVLDVFKSEPLPSDSKLWSHPQVTISPHVSGMSTHEPVADLFASNYKRYCNGESLLYQVDWASGY